MNYKFNENNNSTLIGQKNIILIQGQLLVNSEWLTKKYKIPAKTVKNGISRQKSGKSTHWESHKSNTTRLIYLSSIPANTIQKYKIPNDETIIREANASSKYEKISQENAAKGFNHLLIECCLTKYLKYLSFYHEYNLPVEEKSRLAKSHAVLDLLISFSQFSTKEKYMLYNQYYDDSFSFKASNYAYFAQKLREIKIVGIPNALTKKYYGNSNAIKVTREVYQAIMHLYKAQVKLSVSEITKRVNIFFLSKKMNTVSETSVYMAINSNNRLKNILTYKRNGEKWAKDRILEKMVRESAHYPGDQYQMDASRLQVAYKGANNKPASLVIAVLMDVCSRKILAVEFNETETVDMYEKLLRRTIRNTKFLPFEILTDNLPQFQNANTGFYELMSSMESKGVQWRKHRPQNPADKGHVESFFKKFQNKYCKRLEGYVGEGITSKNKDAHPSPEFISESLKSKNLRTKAHLIDRVLALVANYNNDPLQKESADRDSPNYIFDDLDKPNVIPISDTQIPAFIYSKKTLTVRNCSVCIKQHGIPNYFKIQDINTAMSLNNSQVDIRIDEAQEIVHCYHSTTGEYLGFAEKVHPVNMAAANQTSRDIRMINESFLRDKQIHQYLQKELFSFEQNSLLQDNDLAFINPISYTKDEIKNAEDKAINNLYVASTNIEKGERPDRKRKQIVKTISAIDESEGSDSGIGISDQISKLLFKK
jgi:hypothetical protein